MILLLQTVAYWHLHLPWTPTLGIVLLLQTLVCCPFYLLWWTPTLGIILLHQTMVYPLSPTINRSTRYHSGGGILTPLSPIMNHGIQAVYGSTPLDSGLYLNPHLDQFGEGRYSSFVLGPSVLFLHRDFRLPWRWIRQLVRRSAYVSDLEACDIKAFLNLREPDYSSILDEFLMLPIRIRWAPHFRARIPFVLGVPITPPRPGDTDASETR